MVSHCAGFTRYPPIDSQIASLSVHQYCQPPSYQRQQDVHRRIRHKNAQPTANENMHHFIVEGMRCQSCVSKLEKALYEVPNVEVVSISLQNKEAKIQSQNSSDLLKQIIESAGFQALHSDVAK